MKGIIYYTDSRLEQKLSKIATAVRRQLLKSGLPISSCSLSPLDFGDNIVLDREPGVVTMYEQILAALKGSKEKYVFFCEHDTLYHQSHFDFTPPRDDTFYYNTNVWRCHLRSGKCITYDDLRSVSGLCVNRELAVDHYIKRLELIYKNGFDKITEGNPPYWSRNMGYEPGKEKRSSGVRSEKSEVWRSEHPNVDIRHFKTLTVLQMDPDKFYNTPVNWKETTLDKITSWDLKTMFKV